MSGIGNNLFGTKLTTTRAQIVQILYNLEGEPKVSGTTPFTDLTQDWYQDAILWYIRPALSRERPARRLSLTCR